MRANEAYSSEIQYECCCADISESKWDELMSGAKKANGAKIRSMIYNQCNDIYMGLALQYPNPYESQSVRTDTHIIYVHSAIEYFFRIVS